MKATLLTFALFLGVLGACQDANIKESSKQSSVPTDPLKSEDASEADEKVTPPTQITGAWLGAVVLEKSSTADGEFSKLGLWAYYKGQRIADDPARYSVTISFSSSSNSRIKSSLMESDRAGYQKILQVTGPTQDLVTKAYSGMTLYITIVDNSDYSSDTQQYKLTNVLQGQP